MKIENILFPTDYSHNSEKARNYAFNLAKQFGSTVHLLHVIEPLKYDEIDDEIRQFYDDLRKKLEAKMKKEVDIFNDNNIVTNTEFIIGTRWKEINNYATRNNIDLIVMGSHGFKNKKGELSVGTTSHKVVLTSKLPVLVIKE